MAADSWRKVLRSGATAFGNGVDAGSVPRAVHQPPPPNISVTSWPV